MWAWDINKKILWVIYLYFCYCLSFPLFLVKKVMKWLFYKVNFWRLFLIYSWMSLSPICSLTSKADVSKTMFSRLSVAINHRVFFFIHTVLQKTLCCNCNIHAAEQAGRARLGCKHLQETCPPPLAKTTFSLRSCIACAWLAGSFVSFLCSPHV